MATNESLVFGGLELNPSNGTYIVESFEAPPPEKALEWITNPDRGGGILVRDPLHNNRQATIVVRVRPAASMDAALTAVAALVAKVEETEQNTDGMTLVWTPADSTKSFTLRVLTGSIDVPVTVESGYFAKSPLVTIELTCKPFAYGSDATVSLGSGTAPILTGTLADVTGDVPAEATLTVTNNASGALRHIEWGLEQRYYDAATSLLIDSDSLTTSGYAGTATTRTGAYDPNASGNNVIRASIGDIPVAVCSTGDQGHVGVFRVKARVWTASTTLQIRLAWQDGDGPRSANAWTSPPARSAWAEVDLGVIIVTPTDAGTQRWQGVIEAISVGNVDVSDSVDVDYLVLVPAAEGYGRATAAQGAFAVTSISARDSFTTISLGAALNARTAPVGGTWATSGATTDFTGETGQPVQQSIRRATSSDSGNGRFAILGSTNFTDVEVGVMARLANLGGATNNHHGGAIARWVDSSNYVAAVAQLDNKLVINVILGGSTTRLAYTDYPVYPDTNYRVVLRVYATGRVQAELRTDGGAPLARIDSHHADLATGGTLATGKPGIIDWNASATAVTRYYDSFTVGVPAAESVAAYASRQARFRPDGASRQNSAGTIWGAMPHYTSATGFHVPPAGDQDRTSRVLVKVNVNDVDVANAETVNASIAASVTYTPRYLGIPR